MLGRIYLNTVYMAFCNNCITPHRRSRGCEWEKIAYSGVYTSSLRRQPGKLCETTRQSLWHPAICSFILPCTHPFNRLVPQLTLPLQSSFHIHSPKRFSSSLYVSCTVHGEDEPVSARLGRCFYRQIQGRNPGVQNYFILWNRNQ